jgi:hypothetical protein
MDAKVATQPSSSVPSSPLRAGARPTADEMFLLVLSLVILSAILFRKVYASTLRRVQPAFSFRPGSKTLCRCLSIL